MVIAETGNIKTSMVFFVGSSDLDTPFLRQEQICDSADPFVCFADISPNRGITPALRGLQNRKIFRRGSVSTPTR